MLHTKVKKIIAKRVLILQTIFSALNCIYTCLKYCFPKIAETSLDFVSTRKWSEVWLLTSTVLAGPRKGLDVSLLNVFIENNWRAWRILSSRQ